MKNVIKIIILFFVSVLINSCSYINVNGDVNYINKNKLNEEIIKEEINKINTCLPKEINLIKEIPKLQIAEFIKNNPDHHKEINVLLDYSKNLKSIIITNLDEVNNYKKYIDENCIK